MARPVRPAPPRHGLARVLSKAGLCSRTQAAAWIAEGRVAYEGRTVRDPEFAVPHDRRDRVTVDGRPLAGGERIYLMLNKPRGLVTTRSDERGRDTVYACLQDASLPWLAPVGRLDRASEGLLLFSNDPEWAAAVTDPERGPDKVYHVQIDRVPDNVLLERLCEGVREDGEVLRTRRARLLRSGGRTAWLEIVLDEGRNRQIRRLLAALEVEVLRLVRVAIGPLALDALAKGQWRRLTPAEARALVPGGSDRAGRADRHDPVRGNAR